MLSCMGRTALELIGQAGLGYSFDPLVEDSPAAFASAIKEFQYVFIATICGHARLSLGATCAGSTAVNAPTREQGLSWMTRGIVSV